MSEKGHKIQVAVNPLSVALSYRLIDGMEDEMAYLLYGMQIFSGNMYVKAVTNVYCLGSTNLLPTAQKDSGKPRQHHLPFERGEHAATDQSSLRFISLTGSLGLCDLPERTSSSISPLFLF